MIENEYLMFENYAEILINSKKFGKFNIKIDLKNVNKCRKIRWSIDKFYNKEWKQEPIYYAINSRFGLLHRFIVNCPKDYETDHIDMNTLDCREDNLRIVTHSQSQMNRGLQKNNKSGITGVIWVKTFEKWMAYLQRDGIQKTLGYFENKEDAIKVRENAEIEYFKEYRNKYE
jgi:hypothetical protein